jgi:DNA repair protein RadC
VYSHLHPYLTGRETERMVVVACDVRGQPLATEVVAEGGPNEVSVRISDLFTPALRHRAVAIVIAHNHPSNDPEPGPQDLRLTERVRQAADLLEIHLLDHLIIAGARFVSLRLQGVPGLLEDAAVSFAAWP